MTTDVIYCVWWLAMSLTSLWRHLITLFFAKSFNLKKTFNVSHIRMILSMNFLIIISCHNILFKSRLLGEDFRPHLHRSCFVFLGVFFCYSEVNMLFCSPPSSCCLVQACLKLWLFIDLFTYLFKNLERRIYSSIRYTLFLSWSIKVALDHDTFTMFDCWYDCLFSEMPLVFCQM